MKGTLTEIKVTYSTHDGYHAELGNMYAWQVIKDLVVKYQTASLIDGHFRNHKIVDSFQEALDRLRFEVKETV